ncbi:DMT family transporter [Streptomyces sp. WAC00263]|uniref:DMT family transporter n=1 Tax=Streptomyces sp. WAC00263 TaxID=1917422 RepID=UPI0015EE48FA|nr:DMT family transporter [Streptomyces sp. WAC00263]KAF5999188.1 EamA family transporter [Streptomyces sp. WAC00263]
MVTALPLAPGLGRPRPVRMLAIAVAWGACFLLISWGLRDAPPLWFAALRALLAGAALLAAVVWTAHRRRTRVRVHGAETWLLIGLLALVNVTVALGAMVAAASGTTTGVASVLGNAQPLLVVLPAWWLFGERPRPVEVAGVALGFGGLVLVAAPSGAGRGAGLALAAAAAIAAGSLLARRLAGVDLLALGAWQFLLGGGALAVAAAVVEGPPDISWTPRLVTALVALALAGTAFPYVLWFAELRRAPLTAVAAWTLLVPVVGVVLGAVVLGEGLTPAVLGGDALVVASLTLVARSGRTPAAGRRDARTGPARRGEEAATGRGAPHAPGRPAPLCDRQAAPHSRGAKGGRHE